ncbi:MAG: signal recognition particle-docking protein FtsY [Nitrososphaerales archaeon]
MFDKLRRTLSDAVRSIGEKELSEQDIDKIFTDLQISLLESDVAQEVIDDLADRMKNEVTGQTVEKGDKAQDFLKKKLEEYLLGMFEKAGTVDLFANINKKKSKKEPYSIVFLGINGTGKTTTIAKVANMLKKKGFSLVIAAADTHRAGAIEQISQHASKLAIKVVAQRYGADPAAVGRDAILHAKSSKVDTVLIDTAGRMQTSKNLMDEMGKIIRVVNPDLKIFIGDSLAGNDTINQAREFYQYTKFDGAILTKTDADAKGGAAISIVHITGKPIIYLGMGQEYDDLATFDPSSFVSSILGDNIAG